MTVDKCECECENQLQNIPDEITITLYGLDKDMKGFIFPLLVAKHIYCVLAENGSRKVNSRQQVFTLCSALHHVGSFC